MHAKRAKELWERGATAVLCVGLLMLPVALHWELVWSGRIVSGVDTPQAYFPLRWLVYRMWRSGAAPWWNEYLLGGMPLAAQPDAQAWYMPGWLLFFVLSPATAFNITLMLHYGMAGVFTFLFLRRMQLSDVAALCGALSFMWCGFLTGHRVHSAMVETAIWLPGVLWGLAGWCETQRRRWLVITTATTTLQLLCGYMQIVLMTWGAAALLLVVWTCTRGLTWRAGGVAVLALLAGALLAACQVLMVWEFAKQCTRATLSYEQFCHGAYPLDELWRALFPFLNGAQWHVSLYRGVPFYRGVENYAELALYAGATLTVAASAACWHWRRRRLLIYAGLLACGAIVLMAGPQTPLWRVFYQLPLLNKFRIPARYALLFQLALAILGAVGLDFVVGDARRRRERVSALVWMGLLLIGITWLVHAGYVPRARLQDPWVRVPLLSAAGVWATVWICLVPGLWGRVIAWLVPVLVGCELVYYGYNGITSDVPRLLDRDQCLVSVRAYHARFGATAPLPRVFNCFRNYMAKDRGIGPNRNILMGVPTLDAYGPLYFKVFGWLGHDPSGFYTTVDELLRDNDTLSMLNAVAVAEYDGAAHGMTRQIWEITNALPIVLPALSAWEGAQRYVSDRDGLRLTGVPGLIYTHVPLRSNSVYRFSVDAAGAGGSQPLHVDLFAPGYDDAAQELIIAPFMLEPCVQRYQHVIETGARAPSRALLRVFTFGERAVLVTNVQFEQLAGELRFVRPEEYYQSGGDGLWRNARACPRAWCVSRIIPSASRWAALDWIAASPVMFDPHKEAMVEGIREAEQMSSGNVSCTAVHANRRRWEVEIAGPRDAFLVVSEVWYPGWEAYVDGRRVAYQRVNGLLGGVRVPPGRHSVEVRFRPRYLVHGGILALVGVGLLAVVVTASRRAVNPR